MKDLNINELKTINGGGPGWIWLGTVVGHIKQTIYAAGEAISDGFLNTY